MQRYISINNHRQIYENIGCICNISNDDNKIYLTFDDGPALLHKYILNILGKYNVKATFFCVGENIENNSAKFKQLIQQGHEIGNHTYSHLDSEKSSTIEYIQEIDRCSDVILKYYNRYKFLFRPPFGRINKEIMYKITPKYNVVIWDILSYDFDFKYDSEECFNNIIKLTQAGSIITFHDNIIAKKNIESVLERYIVYCLNMGFVFETIQ